MAGWEVEIRPRQKAPAVDKNYFSPGGQKFGSMKRVQEHCAFWGIPVLTAEDMPKKGKVCFFFPASDLEARKRMQERHTEPGPLHSPCKCCLA